MPTCVGERTGGLLSANEIKAYGFGGYNVYRINSGGKSYIIGGVPERYAEQYIETAAECDAVILLSAKPEFVGGMDRLLERRPDIEVYGSPAALRNIKEIVNRPVIERLIKDGMTEADLKFHITPGLDWVDTVMVTACGALFSGQAFSSGADGMKAYYDERLAVNRGFVLSALDRLKGEDISVIYPAYGKERTAEAFNEYRRWSAEHRRDNKRAAVIYSSGYGYTKMLAERAAEALGRVSDVSVFDVGDCDIMAAVEALNAADLIAVGTNTINRNAPQGIWDVITRTDTVNKRGTPYFTFGSFGWAGDGIKLTDKTLSAMGLRRAAKPVEVLFRPTEKDLEKIDKAVEELIDYEERYHQE